MEASVSQDQQQLQTENHTQYPAKQKKMFLVTLLISLITPQDAASINRNPKDMAKATFSAEASWMENGALMFSPDTPGKRSAAESATSTDDIMAADVTAYKSRTKSRHLANRSPRAAAFFFSPPGNRSKSGFNHQKIHLAGSDVAGDARLYKMNHQDKRLKRGVRKMHRKPGFFFAPVSIGQKLNLKKAVVDTAMEEQGPTSISMYEKL